MLVSAIANFQAIHAQHRTGLMMMQTHEAMLGGIRQAGMGSGTNFNALHQQDVKNDTQLAGEIEAELMKNIDKIKNKKPKGKKGTTVKAAAKIDDEAESTSASEKKIDVLVEE